MTLGNGSFISPFVNRALIEQAFSAKQSENLLTARELQIANGIIEGLSYKNDCPKICDIPRYSPYLYQANL